LGVRDVRAAETQREPEMARARGRIVAPPRRRISGSRAAGSVSASGNAVPRRRRPLVVRFGDGAGSVVLLRLSEAVFGHDEAVDGAHEGPLA